MRTGPRLTIRQTQRLALTPGLRQSVEILSLTGAELAARIDHEAAENPYLSAPSRNREWDPATVAAEVSVLGHLGRQIAVQRLTAGARQVAEYLAASLDDDGYLRDAPEEAARALGFGPVEAAAGLVALQACEPAGVGARDINECLALQIAEAGFDDIAGGPLRRSLAQLRGRDPAQISRTSGLPQERARALSAALEGADPRPLARLSAALAPRAVPDLALDRNGDVLRVILSPASDPPTLLPTPDNADAQARVFARGFRRDGQRLITAINARNRTLLRLVQCIVDRQSGYFERGRAAIAPLRLNDLAVETGLHPSTVGRALRGICLDTGRGVIALETLLSGPVRRRDGFEVSVAAVTEMIRAAIAVEHRDSPLSDGAIATLLQNGGIDISRRTVAKYRSCIGLASSHVRRRIGYGKPLRNTAVAWPDMFPESLD